MDDRNEWDPDYEIDTFAETELNIIKDVSELSQIITDTVLSNTGIVAASVLNVDRDRLDPLVLEERLKRTDCGDPEVCASQRVSNSTYTTESKEQLIVVIRAADRDDRWSAPLPGSRPSELALTNYSSIGAISRHLCLNLEQHLMFSYFARTIMFTVGAANGIDEDDLPSSLKPSSKQKIGFLNGGAGMPNSFLILGFGKSAVISALQFAAQNWKVPDSVRTASFCGIAAANVKGGTLSSMFGWSIFTSSFSSPSKPKPSQEASRKEYQACAILIIDEVSTLTQGYFGLLDTSLRLLRPGERDQPAGGFNLLLIGIIDYF